MNIGFVRAGHSGQNPHLNSSENVTYVDTKLALFGRFSMGTARRSDGPRTVRTSRRRACQAKGGDPPECLCRPRPAMAGSEPHCPLLVPPALCPLPTSILLERVQPLLRLYGPFGSLNATTSEKQKRRPGAGAPRCRTSPAPPLRPGARSQGVLSGKGSMSSTAI